VATIGVVMQCVILSLPAEWATIVMAPADHGIRNVDEFQRGVRAAAAHVDTERGDIVLLGMKDHLPAEDFGWIVSTAAGPGPMAAVRSFVEKPPSAQAAQLFSSDAVWNTSPPGEGSVVDLFGDSLLTSRRRSKGSDSCLPLDGSIRFGTCSNTCQQWTSQGICWQAPEAFQGLAWRASIGWTGLRTPERPAAWIRSDEGGPGRPLPADRA